MTATNATSPVHARELLTRSGGGRPFGDVWLPPSARVSRVYVHSADYIDGLQFEYRFPGGARGFSPFVGGVGGWRESFEVPDEDELIGLSGTYGRFVHSLRFHTRTRDSVEFGRAHGERFLADFGGGYRFRGVFGWESCYVDSLGVLLEEMSDRAGAGLLDPGSLSRLGKGCERRAA